MSHTTNLSSPWAEPQCSPHLCLYATPVATTTATKHTREDAPEPHPYHTPTRRVHSADASDYLIHEPPRHMSKTRRASRNANSGFITPEEAPAPHKTQLDAISHEGRGMRRSAGVFNLDEASTTDLNALTQIRADSPLNQPTKRPRAAESNRIVIESAHSHDSNLDERSFLNRHQTPTYERVKPLQTAFVSSGLQSKLNRQAAEGGAPAHPPETPCKRPSGSFAHTHAMAHPSTPLFSTRQRNAENDTSSNLYDSIRRISLNLEPPETPTKDDKSPAFNPVLSSTPIESPVRRKASVVSPFQSFNLSADSKIQTPGRIGDTSTPYRGRPLFPSGNGFRSRMNSDAFPETDTTTDSLFSNANMSSMTQNDDSGDWQTPKTPKVEPQRILSPSTQVRSRTQGQRWRPPFRLAKTLIKDRLANRGSSPVTNTTNVGRSSSQGPPPRTPTALSPPDLQNPDVNTSVAGLVEPDQCLRRRFRFASHLGTGEFSQVFLVGDESGHSRAVVKRTKRSLLGPRELARRMEEVMILRKLVSKTSTSKQDLTAFNEDTEDNGGGYVVQYMDSWQDMGHLFIQTEYCENGSLDKFLSKWGNNARLEEWRVWKILLEVALGLAFVHSHSILHLDLKPANVFITFDGSLKIGDFGLAVELPVRQEFEREGDREYIAPEVLEHGIYGLAADVFSFGIMMVEIAANIVLPDNGEHWHKLRSGDLSDAGRLSSGDLCAVSRTDSKFSQEQVPPWAPPFMVGDAGTLDKVVSTMISPNPELRPSAAALLESPEVLFVEQRRRSGAVVYEGEFGPTPASEEDKVWQL